MPTMPLLPLRLRPTLLSVMLGLLGATVFGIGGIAFLKTSETIEVLADQQFNLATQAARERVQKLVDETPRILLEYQSRAQRDMMPLDDTKSLGIVFTERLRQHPDFAWIGYGSTISGEYVGATRRSQDAIRLYTAKPNVQNGVPVEEEISPDGDRLVVAGVESQPYYVKEKEWFRKSISLSGINWLDSYTFTDGRRGVTAVLPLRASESGKTLGVLHIDVFIHTLEQRLDQLKVGRTGRLHLLDRSGRAVASPRAWRNSDPILKAALGSIAGRRALASLRPGDEPSVIRDLRGSAWRAAFHHVSIPGGPDWIVAVVAPEHEFTGVARDNALWTLAAAAVGLSLAAWIAQIISRRIAEPLQDISDDLMKIGRFDFEGRQSKPSFIREVETLRSSAGKMKASLRSFSRYVPTDVVRELLLSGQEAQLSGHRQKLTVYFSDIKSFTSVAEMISAEHLVDELGLYFSLMVEALQEQEGTLDKFMGDGIMAFFNAPRAVEHHETKACLAALECQQRLAADRQRRSAAGRPEFSARIGLASGDVIVGNVGTPERFGYTAIGDVVNLASRLEGLCKYYGVAIIACAEVHSAAGEAFEWRALDRVAVVGRRSGTDIYELLGRKGNLSAEQKDCRDAYEVSLSDYFQGRFEQASQGFLDVCHRFPTDSAARLMAARSEEFCRCPPDDHWQGIFIHKSK